MDIAKAVSQIQIVKQQLQYMRSSDHLLSQVRSRRCRRLFDYESQDDPRRVKPRKKFRIEFFYNVLDVAINAIAERFQLLEALNMRFGFLYRANDTVFRPSVEQCNLLQQALAHPATNQSDIDASELFSLLEL